MEKIYRHLLDIAHNTKKLAAYATLLFISFLTLALAIWLEPSHKWLDNIEMLDAAKSLRLTLGLLLIFIIYSYIKAQSHSISTIAISHYDLLKKYRAEKKRILSLHGFKLHSIFIHQYEENTNIKKLSLSVEKQAFQLPWYVAQYSDALIRRFNPAKTFNGLTLRLTGIEKTDHCHFLFQFASYYDYLVTNGSHDSQLFNELTVRDILEPGPSLNPLEGALCANHLGLSALIISSDQYLLLQLRSKNVSTFARELAPSVSGAANYSTFSGEDDVLSFENWFFKEMSEELSDKITSQYFNAINCLGISRELIRLGKPELFFIATSSKTRSEINAILRKPDPKKLNTNGDIISSAANHADALKNHETERFIWIKSSMIFNPDNLKLRATPDKKGLQVTIDKKDYKISESLAANLAFWIMSLKK